jgi:alkylation response protein AidB-like acyl-CoA dehydrogenase
MDASLNEEQRILRETIAQIAADMAPPSVADLPARGDGSEEWSQLAEIGLLGMRIPEEAGGGAFSGVEVVLAAEELGKQLVPLPFIGSAVSATSLLVAAGASHDLLGSLGDGSRRLTVALDPTLTRLARAGEDSIAWESRGAEAALALDREGRHLVALAMEPTPYGVIDLTRELRPVRADANTVDVGDLGGALDAQALERWQALTLAALSADLVGVMQAALDAAVKHTASREQFGVAIGTFQAVQHMAAEAAVSTEAARGLAWYAAWAVDELPSHEALLAARTAKAYCSERGREVVETSMQMHGGVAFTWEYTIHLLARRALLDRQTLGDEHEQLELISGERIASAVREG